MKHFHEEWLQEWCDNNGWTDLFAERHNHYWAFPPNGVMPEPIPSKVLITIKKQKGFSEAEKRWTTIAIIMSLVALVASYVTVCPLPIMLAFCFDAVVFALMECEV